MNTDNYAADADTQELILIGKLPTALALAEHLEKTMQWPLHGKAADELRRLHAANIDCTNHFEAIKAERDELLAALNRLLPMAEDNIFQYGGKPGNDEDIVFARAAIAKAQGGAA